MKKYNRKEIDAIADSLLAGKLIAIKADNVYAIRAIATGVNEKRINELKKSDSNKKISIMFPTVELLLDAIEYIEEPKIVFLKSKLPDKYNLVVDLTNYFSESFGRKDFGVRIAIDPILQEIIELTGPLLSSSCNITGEEPCTTVEEIEKIFGDTELEIVID